MCTNTELQTPITPREELIIVVDWPNVEKRVQHEMKVERKDRKRMQNGRKYDMVVLPGHLGGLLWLVSLKEGPASWPNSHLTHLALC
jgi:hypothetical protein